MAPRERVTMPLEHHQPFLSGGAGAPLPRAAAPWSAAPALLTTLEDAAHNAQQQELPDSTGIDAFEPLPDSPSSKHGPTGPCSDQHHEHAAPKAKQNQKALPEGLPAPPPGPRPGTAHMHLIGEVTGACGLGCEPLYCTWQLVYDTQWWSVIQGLDKGRTHASSPLCMEDGSLSGVVWECPLDVTLATSGVQHWPSLVFKLFQRSVLLGRDAFVGYGLVSLPNTPGCHHLSCPIWAATEGTFSLAKELTKLFTGLHPQLVNEAFITDMEQRYEQGQHLHTLGISSGSSALHYEPGGHAMVRVGGAGGAAGTGAGGALRRPFCTSFSAAGSGGTAAPGAASAAAGAEAGGGRITVRVHVLTRGMESLGRWRGDGAESIGRCLERLHSSVDKPCCRRGAGALAEGSDEDGDEAACSSEQVAEESEGVQLVRAGRAGRMAAVQQALQAGNNKGRDGMRPRDQQQQQQQVAAATNDAGALLSYAGSAAGEAAGWRGTHGTAGSSSASSSRATAAGRLGSSSSNSVSGAPAMRSGLQHRDEPPGTRSPGLSGARSSAWGEARPQSGRAGSGDRSLSDRLLPRGGLAADARQECGSPLRSAPVIGSRWAGRFGAAGSDSQAAASSADAGAGTGPAVRKANAGGEPLLPAAQERS